MEAKKEELKTARKNLKTVYDENVSHAKDRTAVQNAYIQTQITQTAAAQEMARKQAGSNIASQDLIYNAQIAELQVQTKQQEGSAIQGAATSGFRGSSDLSGTIGAAVRETNRAGSRAIEQAQLQARANRMQSYQSALNNYTSAEMQKALYSQQQQMNQKELTRTLESLKTEFDQKEAMYKADLDTQEDWKYKTLRYLGVGLDLTSTGIDATSKIYSAGVDAKWWGTGSTTQT